MKLLVAMLVPFLFVRIATAQTSRPTSRPVRVMGTLVEVKGKDLVIQRDIRPGAVVIGDGDKPVTVTTDGSTEIRLDGDPAVLGDLEPKMSVTAIQVPMRGGRWKLVVAAWTQGLSGIVTKVDGKDVVMNVASRGGAETTVQTDENTKILFVGVVAPEGAIRPREGTISDLKPAMKVKVVPPEGVAKKIFVSPLPGQHPPTSAPKR